MDGSTLIVRGRTAEDVLKLLQGDRLVALAIAIADHTARSDIEIYAQHSGMESAVYDLTAPADDEADVTIAQRAARYIHERGDVWPWQMVEVDGNPNRVRFVDRDSKTADDGMCYCQEGVVCPTCEHAALPKAPATTAVFGPVAIAAAAPTTSIQILIQWLFRRFGAPIDAGELPQPVVTAVREIEHWLNPLLPMPEAPR